jgi:hypothetical protein
MSEQKFGDLSKVNLYDADEGQLGELKQSQEDIIKSLERRYEQPNLFKISAALMQPRLGGFGAALGAASDVLGENIEKQRESQIPIAQMRAQLAQTNMLLGSKQKAANIAKQWETDHPNEPIPPNLMSRIAGYDKDLAEKLKMGVSQNLEQRTLSQKEQAQQKDLLEGKQRSLDLLAKNGTITTEQRNSGVAEINRQLDELMRIGPFGNPTRDIPNAGGLKPQAEGALPPATNAAPTAPLPAAQNQPTNQNQSKVEAPQSADSNLYNYKLQPTYSTDMKHPNPMTENDKANNARIDAQAAALEKGPAEQFSLLQKLMNPTQYSSAKAANKEIEKMVKENPQAVANVSELLRKQGPLLNLLASGIGVHLGPYGATINLKGAEKAIVSSLPKDQRDTFDKLTNAMATSTYYDLLSRGIDPEKEGAEKFGQMMLQEAGLSQGASAIFRASQKNKERLLHSKQFYKTMVDLYPKMSKANSLTPYYDLYNKHPEIQVLNKMLEHKLENIQ